LSGEDFDDADKAERLVRNLAREATKGFRRLKAYK
jgi:hypothetical protein